MNCKICGVSDKDFKGRFYDSGIYGRPLCSKECYSKWFDIWNKAVVLDNEQKNEQRKRSNKYYAENKDYWKGRYEKQKQNGLAGAI
jgi:hypothetical protein